MASARLARPERESQMLQIATEVFCERGFAGASMNEIARRCDVSKPMLYLYFGSKDGLYLACLTFVGEGLIAAIEESVAGARTPSEQVFATAAGLFGYAEQRQRSWWGVIYAETMPADSAVAEATAGYRMRIFAIINRAMSQVFSDADDAEAASHALIGAGESLLRWWVHRPADSAEDMARRLQRILGPFLTNADRG